jgi:hypothetical protein
MNLCEEAMQVEEILQSFSVENRGILRDLAMLLCANPKLDGNDIRKCLRAALRDHHGIKGAKLRTLN